MTIIWKFYFEYKGVVMNRILNRFWILVLIIITMSLNFSCTQKKGNIAGKMEENKELKIWKVPNVDNGAEFYFSPDGSPD